MNAQHAQDRKVSGKPMRNRRRRERHSFPLSHRNREIASFLKERLVPRFALLQDSELRKIEDHADWLLENIGMEFRDDPVAVELFRDAGARIEGNRVRFEPGLARALCKTAPATFKLHARNSDLTVQLGDNNIVLMPGYGSPFVSDLDAGRRYATLEDFQNFVKLTYSSPCLHHSGGTVVEPVDIPVNKRHLDMTLAHLCLSAKPFMGSVTAPERAADSIKMAEIVFGRNFMQHNAVMQANININSPFVFDDTMSGALRAYAEANQCVLYFPCHIWRCNGPREPGCHCCSNARRSNDGGCTFPVGKARLSGGVR